MPIKKYTKMIKVSAVQWTGENLEEVKAFLKEPKATIGFDGSICFEYTEDALLGEWIVVKGNYEDSWVESDEDFIRNYTEVPGHTA